MPKKLIDSLSDVAARGAKPAMRDGMPVDRKLHDGLGLYLLGEPLAPSIGASSVTWPGANDCWHCEYLDVPLARARQKAGEARNLIREGIDPIQNGREQGLACERRTQTLRALATAMPHVNLMSSRRAKCGESKQAVLQRSGNETF